MSLVVAILRNFYSRRVAHLPTTMRWFIAGCIILLKFSSIIGSSLSTEDTELDYSYPDYMLENDPFRVPGLAVADLHAAQFLEALGRAWDVAPLVDGVASMCEELAPRLDRPGLKRIVRSICDPIRNSDVEESCRFIWDFAVSPAFGYGHPHHKLFSTDCKRDWYGHYGKVIWYDNEKFQGYEQYPLIRDVKHLFDTVLNFTLYDFCSENGRGAEKVNNIIFALMDWLGPLVQVVIDSREFVPHATCSIARHIISMDPTLFIEQSINILKYPLADVLEYLGTAAVCRDQSDNVGMELLKDLLVEFSDMVEDEFCEAISEGHTRNEYLEKGVTILENVLIFFQEEQRCDNVLSVLAPIDEGNIHVKYIGFDLSVLSQRREFCRQINGALSPSSSYVPSPYHFPYDVNINQWQPFKIPGQFLPGLSLIDLIKIEGAAYRAGTIVEGWTVYCTVFEEFLVQYIHDETFDVSSICEFIKSGNTEGLEDICVGLLLYEGEDESYKYGHIGLPSFIFPCMYYTIGELTSVMDIDKDDICRAADDLLHGEMSLKNLIEVYVDAYMRELIPVANRYCQHWEEAICYWKPYCYLSSQPPRHSDYLPFNSSPSEDIAAIQASFDDKLASVVSLMLTLTGYEELETFCSAMLEDVDPTSGRAVGGLTQKLRSELTKSLSIVSRCSQLLDTVFGLIPERTYAFPDGEILYQLSGFRTSSAFCEFLSDSLSQNGVSTLKPETTESKDILATPYDIFMKITVYLEGKSL